MAYVLDFTKRLNQSYHRNHAHILPSDANQRAQVLPERVVQVFQADSYTDWGGVMTRLAEALGSLTAGGTQAAAAG